MDKTGKGVMIMGEKRPAERNLLGGLPSRFAQINGDVLFGEVGSKEERLSPAAGDEVQAWVLGSALPNR